MNFFKKIRVLLALLFVVSLLGGCAFLAEKFGQKPEVTLQKVYLKDAQFLSATMVFVVHVKNPNKIGLTLEQLDYEVQLGGRSFSKSVIYPKIEVPAGGEADVEIPMEFEYLKVLSSLQDALQGKNIVYGVSGKAKVSGFTVPFDQKGEVKLRQ